MKQRKRKFFGILFSLLLVLSFLQCMSLKSLAYDGNPYNGMVNTTTIVRFNDMDWYIIKDNSTAVNAGTLTLFAKNPIGASKFHDSSNVYSTSTIKNYLDGLTTASGSFAGVADAIVATDLSDVTVTGAKLWLLSKDEADALSENVRKCSKASGAKEDLWWLRSVGTYAGDVWSVYGASGAFISAFIKHPSTNVVYYLGVRPALKLNLSSVIFSSVNLSGGVNATVGGGSSSQNYFDVGSTRSAMTTVTYTANTGYRFPETSAFYTTTNGITVTRTSDKVVTVSGTPNAISTSITIPDPISEPEYVVTINNGTGGGSHFAGNTVTITANPPAAGKIFDKWEGADNLTFTTGSATTATAAFTMPANAVTVTATYKDMDTVTAPTFSPVGGTYTTAQNVTISSTTNGATIYYTTDGSTPTTGSTRYTGPISVSSTTSIKAIAVKDGMQNSAVSQATFTITTTETGNGQEQGSGGNGNSQEQGSSANDSSQGQQGQTPSSDTQGQDQQQPSGTDDQATNPAPTATEEKTETVDKKQKNTKLSKPKAGKKSITLTWKKATAKGIKGYEIQCSTDKNFQKGVKTVTIKKTKTTSTTIKKLKSKKKYFVRIRTFKKSGSEKVYSKWSKAKAVKVK